MVSKSYEVERPAPPSEAQRFFDQKIIPAAIDAAGAVEAVVERVAVQVRAAPLAGVGAAFLVGVLAGLFLFRRGVR